MTTSSGPRLDRAVLWRAPDSVQLGVDPRHAVVIDGLSPGLAEVLRRLDGRHGTDELLGAAVAAGTDRASASGLLRELADRGLLETPRPVPAALDADAAVWRLRTGRPTTELLERRAGATVEVHGDGRIAIAVATALAAAAVGSVVVRTAGRVDAGDVGTGYLAGDVGRPRRAAAAEAVARAATVTPADAPPEQPDVVVLADGAAWDPGVALRLGAERVPHLAVYGRESGLVVGPLVLPGRTSCLRCADLHRTDADPCWPRVAAQLSARPPRVSLAGAQVAAGMAAEHVLALLACRGEPADEPPAAGTTFEFDPLLGGLVRRRWPVHRRCGCHRDRSW